MSKFDYIDWSESVRLFGYVSKKLAGSDKVAIRCVVCEKIYIIKYVSVRSRHKGKPFERICMHCGHVRVWKENEEYRAKQSVAQSTAMKEVWKDQAYRDNMSVKVAENMTELWKDEEFRTKVTASLVARHASDPVYRNKSASTLIASIPQGTAAAKAARLDPQYCKKIAEKISLSGKLKWQDPEFLAKMSALRESAEWRQQQSDSHSTPEMLQMASERAKALWENPAYARRVFRATKSGLEDRFARLLSRIGIAFVRQKHLGRWFYDFYLPKYQLLIEVHGNYWHLKPKNIKRDWLKGRHACQSGFRLVIVWGHEFRYINCIKERLINLCKLCDFCAKL